MTTRSLPMTAPGTRAAGRRPPATSGSAALADAVVGRSALHGAAAVRGELGRGRDGNQSEA
jgi:hypothetical protein